MKEERAGTYAHRLPNGEVILCWKHEQAAILRDVRLTGTVRLFRNPLTGVYERLGDNVATPRGARRVVG